MKARFLKELSGLGFEQMAKFPTHMEGRIIDHIHFFSPNEKYPMIRVNQQSPYFTDHDLLFVSEVSNIMF